MPFRCRARSSLSAVLAGTALLLPACTSTTSGSGTPASADGATDAAAGDDSISAMLALLPPLESAELGVVTVSRWHAAAEAYGVPVPPAGAPTDDVLDYFSSLTIDQGGLTAAGGLVNLDTVAVDSAEEQFGYAVQQVAADIGAGLPPRTVSAARGDVDPDAVVAATLAGPVAADVEQVEVDGVPVLRWREDFDTDLDQRTALSPTGAAGRLGVPGDGTLLYAGWDDGMAGLVSAQQGGESLADDEDLAAVAGALDGEDVLSAQLTTHQEGSDLPYRAVGIGIAEDGGARVVLVYATASDADASAVADAVEELVTSGRTVAGNRPWSDLLADPDVRTDGSLVVATFTAVGPAGRWPAFLYQREALF